MFSSYDKVCAQVTPLLQSSSIHSLVESPFVKHRPWIINYWWLGERVVIHGHSPKRFLLLQIPGVLRKLSQGDDPRFCPWNEPEASARSIIKASWTKVLVNYSKYRGVA